MWIYKEEKDSFDGKIAKYCSLRSETTIDDVFVEINPRILVRQYNKKAQEIMLIVEGKVIGHPEGKDIIRMKFDNEDPISVGFSGTTDSSADKIFLRSTSKIIAKFKTAKTLTVEIPFFMESTQRFKFNVSGYNELCKF